MSKPKYKKIKQMPTKEGIAPVLFEHEMFATSRIFSRDSKVRVKIGGTKAYTTDTEIVLPAIDHSKPIEDFTARVARGYVDHEGAHKRHTDIKGGWVQKAEALSKFAGALFQGIEDVRIEALNIDEYPGSKTNLEAATQAVLDRLVEIGTESPFDKDSASMLLPALASIAGRFEQLNYQLTGIDDLKTMLPAGVWDKASEIASHTPGLKSTKDAYDLMVKYADIDDDGDDENEGDGPGKGQAGQGGSSGGNGNGDPIQVGLDEILTDLLGRGGDGTPYGGEAPYIAAREYDSVSTNKDHRLNKDAKFRGRYDQILAGMGAQVQAVKQAFERGLLIDTNRGWEGGQIYGRIDPRRLGGVPAGAEAVFRKRDQQKDLDVAVCLLVDASGSMCGEKMEMATQVCIALAEALNKLAIPFEVAVFDSEGSVPQEVAQWATRWSRLRYVVMKTYDERLFECRASMAKIEDMSNGGTPEGAALEVAYLRIKQRHERRKVILTMVDGGPGVAGPANEGAFLSELIKYIRRDPAFTLASIGIMTDSPKEYYGEEYTAAVHRLGDLPTVAFQRIRQMLVPSKPAPRAA